MHFIYFILYIFLFLNYHAFGMDVVMEELNSVEDHSQQCTLYCSEVKKLETMKNLFLNDEEELTTYTEKMIHYRIKNLRHLAIIHAGHMNQAKARMSIKLFQNSSSFETHFQEVCKELRHIENTLSLIFRTKTPSCPAEESNKR